MKIQSTTIETKISIFLLAVTNSKSCNIKKEKKDRNAASFCKLSK